MKYIIKTTIFFLSISVLLLIINCTLYYTRIFSLEEKIKKHDTYLINPEIVDYIGSSHINKEKNENDFSVWLYITDTISEVPAKLLNGSFYSQEYISFREKAKNRIKKDLNIDSLLLITLPDSNYTQLLVQEERNDHNYGPLEIGYYFGTVIINPTVDSLILIIPYNSSNIHVKQKDSLVYKMIRYEGKNIGPLLD